MRHPNVFIIGAPKAGTTSIARWLGQHPKGFLPTRKEPHFFSNIPNWSVSESDYIGLYEAADPERHSAVIDASTTYLDHPESIRKVMATYPDARFIVSLRSPVSMIQALHGQQVWSGTERYADLETAWRAEAKRTEKELTRLGGPTYLYRYSQRCRIGSHLRKVTEIVNPDRLLVIFLEDLKADPRGEYKRVMDFLGLEDDGRQSFEAENSAKVPKFPTLNWLLRRGVWFRRKIGIDNGLGLFNLVDRLTTLQRKRQSVSNEMLDELRTYYRKDVHEIERITGRDLSHWY